MNDANAYESIQEFMADLLRLMVNIISIAERLEKLDTLEQRETMSKEYEEMKTHITNRFEATYWAGNIPFVQLYLEQKLTDFQMFVLLCSLLSKMSQEVNQIMQQKQENNFQAYPIKEWILSIYQVFASVESDYLEFLSGAGVYALLFEKSQGNQMLGLLEPVVLKEAVFTFLYGRELLHGNLESVAWKQGLTREEDVVFVYQEEAKRLSVLYEQESASFLVMTGEEGSGKKFLVRYVARRLRKSVIFVSFEALRKETDLIDILHGLLLESVLTGNLLCLVDMESTNQQWENQNQIQMILRFFQKYKQRLFLISNHNIWKEVAMVGTFASIVLERMDHASRIHLWNHFLQKFQVDEGVTAEYLGSRYVATTGQVKWIMETAALDSKSMGKERIGLLEITEALRQQNANRLTHFAETIETGYEWKDLVVEERVERQLRYICSRLTYKNLVENVWGFAEKIRYGKGVCVLFYGPPGTGKTMAAQIMAKEMGLELYRIELSRMVSKYIGETQKHITELFEKAKDMNALLFFDEADAFFSKRTEVNDSNDRHANSEVAHLLQKLEEYEGFSILATNLKDHMDSAFKRRMKYVIHFQTPDAQHRQLLWEKAIPEQVPREVNLELDFFARRFELSGSEIKDIVLSAAFMAAQEGGILGKHQLQEAVRMNYAKDGRFLNDTDFLELYS